jgi:hypothetical protein
MTQALYAHMNNKRKKKFILALYVEHIVGLSSYIFNRHLGFKLCFRPM